MENRLAAAVNVHSTPSPAKCEYGESKHNINNLPNCLCTNRLLLSTRNFPALHSRSGGIMLISTLAIFFSISRTLTTGNCSVHTRVECDATKSVEKTDPSLPPIAKSYYHKFIVNVHS